MLFEGSHQYDGSLYLDKNDANDANNPVKISSYGTGKATISSGLSDGLMAYNTAGIVIDHLIFAGNATTTNKNSGINFYNDLPGDIKLNSVKITNCEIFGYRDSGIVIGSWNKNSGFNDVLIENNKVHDILDAGISSYGEFSGSKIGYAHSNIIVRSCEVFNIPGYKKNPENNSGNGIVLSDVQHSVIEYCTAYNSGSGNSFSGGGPVGIWYWDADQVTIQHNEVYGMQSGSNKDGGGFDLDGGVTNGIMQYNYSHDNEGAGYLIGQFGGARPMNNITVRYNISENDAATNGGSVYLFNGEGIYKMKNIIVHNNTLVLTIPGYA
ncbi:right-handed parallel beta-helix repeat-containing protein [Antarcticibacterium sp. 1MA-6-2]|uniref:right-handed parallel beta-helix repeat-containing protein n=1 Tax=Antarcticibacterium sp. 1MA-6-2 TaxID=2908210 RepID=UPI001F3A0504|nr:right-handed parallel beta-helix repeat-containing protein [Antarcticibacterium sp. 1MA-6-2]UJH89717.1 right-handed parallel beta-helix repeat-containing protein [Antarcticibacterium sp. 1MA-6-2]